MPLKRIKDDILVTPPGTAVWPNLTTPNTKFKEEGVYETKLKFSPDDEGLMIEDLTAIYDQGYIDACKEQKKKQLKKIDFPWKPETDAEGNESGFMLFNIKHDASGISKKTGKRWTWKPSIFDAVGKSLADNTELSIGGGSTLKVSFEARPFYVPATGYGISLRLVAVQILDLKSYAGRDAASCGFGAEEGYIAGQAAKDTAGDKEAADGDGDQAEF